MSTSFDYRKLFVPEHTASSPEQRKQIQLFNQLLRSVLVRSKAGEKWIRGIEYDTLMEHFVALQRTRVFRDAEQDRERQLQYLIKRRLAGTEVYSEDGSRVCRESVMVRSRRIESLDNDSDGTPFNEPVIHELEPQFESSPERELEQREEHFALEQAIGSLKQREQLAIRLYMNGANYTQVGISLGVSDVYARKLLAGAFGKLRQLLEKADFGR